MHPWCYAIATKIIAKREPRRWGAGGGASALPGDTVVEMVAAAASVQWVALALSFAIAAVAEALY